MNQVDANKSDQQAPDISIMSKQYLTFMLAGEEYGVDILSVQEIKGWEEVTPLPNSPAYILGVMNLRGSIVPIVDLRKRFSLELVEFDSLTVVIVVKVSVNGASKVMGLVVDAVSDVHNISAEESNTAPDFGCAVDMSFIKGLASVEDKMIILLDVNTLVEAEVLQAAGGERH